MNRRHVLLPAALVDEGGERSLGCTLCNCSDFGAMVRAPADVVLDRQLYFVHPRDGTAYWCRVAWRFGQQVGLEFQKKIDLRRPAREIEFLRALWLDLQPRAQYRPVWG